MQLEESEL